MASDSPYVTDAQTSITLQHRKRTPTRADTAFFAGIRSINVVQRFTYRSEIGHGA
jgi:hypothetical protein